MQISTEAGVSWTDVDASKMEISQDFKATWKWFILHKIGENLRSAPVAIHEASNTYYSKLIRILGLNEQSPYQKIIGFLPKLEGAHVRIKTDLKFFEAELGGDFKPDGPSSRTTLDALNARAEFMIKHIEFKKKIFIYFDELEVFFHSQEQHVRDQRLVRDLIFSIASLNESFRNAELPLHILAAVRSEVIDSMGVLGQEVDRVVHDRGFLISWHHANKSMDHPLLQIIRRKISLSEKVQHANITSDPLTTYFPRTINGLPIDAFLLDKSFYKPRDIVWRLSIAQQLFPDEAKFSERVLNETEVSYSSRLWDEIRYELGATYSDIETQALEGIFSGGAPYFTLSEISVRFEKLAAHSSALSLLLQRRSVREILADLYRLGAIGNSFRTGSTGTQIMHRWAFRGEPNLLFEKQMVIHSALYKRLSIVVPRRRGTR
jgi:hypothetical protein